MIESWPALPYDPWRDTCATLHRWTQIVGKVRLAKSPWTNHSWHVALYVTPRGLTTSPIPHRDRAFEMAFDFIGRRLEIRASDGAEKKLPLESRPVAEFYEDVLRSLEEMGLGVRIDPRPSEIEGSPDLDEDREHGSYDPDAARRFGQVLVQVDRVFKLFRSRFLGKASPVHFFWGSFDLAVTRFSGRRAPRHPGGIPNLPDWVSREAYSHEVSSCGFWPGADRSPQPVFYSYAYPEPDGFSEEKIRPASAFYHEDMGEFFLPYDAVRTAPDPDDALLDFLQTTYEAAANRGRWNREELEVPAPWPPRD
jgi:hypothetical protein